MFDFDAGDVLDKIFEKIEKMSPEECKAALTGGILGFGLAGALFEELEENKKDKKEDKRGYTLYRRNDYASVYEERRRKDLPRQDFRNIRLEFNDREDAEEVLDDLRERLEESKDGFVTVKDLYSLADLPANRIMYEWCWYDLEDCFVERYGENYILRMPPAERVKK